MIGLQVEINSEDNLIACPSSMSFEQFAGGSLQVVVSELSVLRV